MEARISGTHGRKKFLLKKNIFLYEVEVASITNAAQCLFKPHRVEVHDKFIKIKDT
jgi:hypothetical protein